MLESSQETEQAIARQEVKKPLEVVEAVSAEAQDPAEKPADDPQQQSHRRIDEIRKSLDKLDGQLFEFSAKLEDPHFNPDAKVVIEKIMRRIAEQQTALISERDEKEQALHELSADALTSIYQNSITQTPVNKKDQPFNIYHALEGTPAKNLVPPTQKVSPHESHIRDSQIEGQARVAKLKASIEKQSGAIAPIVEARKKINEQRHRQQAV